MSVITRGFWVTCAMALTDFLYTKWVISVKAEEPLLAGGYASILILCSAFVTTSYVKDKKMIIFAMIGAFVGTIAAM